MEQPGENAILDIAKQKFMNTQTQTGIAFIPSQRPIITWEKNQLTTDIQPPKLDINWTTTTEPDIELVRPNSINITVAQYPDIQISFQGNFNTLSSFDQKA